MSVMVAVVAVVVVVGGGIHVEGEEAKRAT